MNIELFKLNPTTRMVDIDKEWISTIKEFKVILKRNKDPKKVQATKEFTFVYHYCDYRSQFSNYSHADRYKQALRNAELEPDFKLEKDTELNEAVEVYTALQETEALKLLTELKEGIHTANKVVKKVRQSLEAKLEEADFDTPTIITVGGKSVPVDPVTQITNRLKALMDIANSIPKTLAIIKEQEEEVKRELAEAPMLRGGATKGVREEAPKVQTSDPLPNLFAT